MLLDAATQMASGVVPERFLREHPQLAQRQVWDASQGAYVTVETSSKHINAMCKWLHNRAIADGSAAMVNRFNPSFTSVKLGAREAAKEDAGIFGWNATGYGSEAPRPAFPDNSELLAALYEVRDQQQAIEAAEDAALESAVRVEQPVAADPWAEARAAKMAAKAAKRAAS